MEVVQPTPNPIDLGKIISESSQDPFWAIRGHAIQAYASLEQSLCSMFSIFTGLRDDLAGVIFFKMRNIRAITEIVGMLLEEKYGKTYKPFWKSLASRVGKLTESRNKVVHWKVATILSDDSYELRLVRPDFIWSFPIDLNIHLSAADLSAFAEECAFIGRLCNMFKIVITPRFAQKMDQDARRTWHDIFLQPVAYPPPDNHPLFQKPQEPENQPPPSQESPPPEKPPGA